MKIATISLAAVLAGCASPDYAPPRPTANNDPTQQCFMTAFADPRLSVLTPKVGSVATANAITIEMLADTSKPSSEAEKEALKLWGDSRMRCIDAGKSFRTQYAPPGWDAAFSGSQTNLVFATAQLYAGQITYGQFNTERKRIFQTAQAAFQDINRQGQERAAQEDAQRRAAALQLFQINQMNRPRTTTCTAFGNMANCTSN